MPRCTLGLLLGLLLGAATAGCGGQATHPVTGTAAAGPATARTAPATTATPDTTRRPARAAPPRPHPAHHRPPPPDPGSLPQTDQLPSAHTGAFRSEMAALWSAVQTGSAHRGHAAFFPEGAYAQVKAIGDPNGDYVGRLLADFDLDVAAAHALLGAGAAQARLLEVQVPGAYAHWVPPGVCLNRVGYFEVPNARVVYAENGGTRSFGIASMISWRGMWYVVHLGAVLRPSAAGVVDDPSPGTGVSAPSSTC